MKQIDTIYLLTQWGIWLRYGDGIPRYVSPQYALMRDNVEQVSYSPRAVISEDLCMTMDGIVARLMLRNQEMGDALAIYYSWGISYAALGRTMGISKTRAESLVKSGEVWVDAVLDDRIAAAA